MNYLIGPDFFVEFMSNDLGFYEVDYLGTTWIQGSWKGFSITSGFRGWVTPGLALGVRSRVIWAISGSQGLFRGVF